MPHFQRSKRSIAIKRVGDHRARPESGTREFGRTGSADSRGIPGPWQRVPVRGHPRIGTVPAGVLMSA
jgi:hypothetical protein